MTPSRIGTPAFGLLVFLGLAVNLARPSPAFAQEPPAAGAPVETGLLRVDCATPGAQVWVDGVLADSLPVSRYVSAGEHSVRVAADGFEPYVRKINVRAGARADLTAQLSPGGGTVEFQINAPGGHVAIDGRSDSALPVRLRDLPPGEHSYLLTAPGHEPVKGVFVFKPGINLFIREDLPTSSGRFSVLSSPEGAAVELDGKPVGQTPLSLEGVAPGLHVVRVDDGQNAALLQVVDTRDGSRGEVNATLSRKGADLVIVTGDDAGEVSLSGVVLGTGRKVNLGKVARGRYAVEVSAPGRKPASGRVNVPPSGKAAYRADLAPEDGRERSVLVEQKPFYQHWAFWTGVGVAAGGATTGVIVAVVGSQPVPAPEGDVVVSLP